MTILEYLNQRRPYVVPDLPLHQLYQAELKDKDSYGKWLNVIYTDLKSSSFITDVKDLLTVIQADPEHNHGHASNIDEMLAIFVKQGLLNENETKPKDEQFKEVLSKLNLKPQTFIDTLMNASYEWQLRNTEPEFSNFKNQEIKLFDLLNQHSPKPVTSETIFQELWPDDIIDGEILGTEKLRTLKKRLSAHLEGTCYKLESTKSASSKYGIYALKKIQAMSP